MVEKQLKPGWRVWRFEQIAQIVNDRIDNPAEAGSDYYVGLEHLDSDSLKIRRWGKPTDVEATKLRFKKGDIIFGRRRAYQRKLAVADFDGICSAHAMVLRARSEVAFPDFLPFFMQSDVFMKRALEISVGSLSPTINWRTLAAQDFALPPLNEQIRITAILRATEDCIQALQMAASYARGIRTAYVEQRLIPSSHAEPRRELGSALSDLAYGASTKSSYDSKGLPILRIPNVLRGMIDLDDLQRVELGERESERFSLRPGDVLLVRTNGNPEYVGRAVAVSSLPEPTVFASYLIRLRCDTSVLEPQFLVELLNAPSIRQSLRGDVRSSAGNFNINMAGIRRQALPIPSVPIQKRHLTRIDRIDETLAAIEARLRRIRDVKQEVVSRLSANV